MNFVKKSVFIVTVYMCAIYFLTFFSACGVEYSLTDCVRYFDEDGRYQLLLVADTYFFFDAKKEHGQKGNIVQYYYDDDIFYGITNSNNQTTYFVFNIKTGEMNEYSNINLLPAMDAKIFKSNSMIQLDKPNDFERQFRKFIPLKYRKK